jgi:hypothetical protein
MATTTATITLSSSDLSSQALSISSSATLLKAGLTTGLDQTTGLTRKLYALVQTATTLIDAADYTDVGGKAHKVYIKNVGTSTTEYFTIELGASNILIGRLYGGDWMFIPYGGEHDIDIDSSAVNMQLEYMVVYEA